jgi:hypothetical protein
MMGEIQLPKDYSDVPMTELELVELTKFLYLVFSDTYGKPSRKIQQVLIGNINKGRSEDDHAWAECSQLGRKSSVFFDSDLLNEHRWFIVEVVCHELAHVWVGCKKGHGKAWGECHKKFYKFARKLLTA